MEYTRRQIPGSGGVPLQCWHTELDRAKPSALLALPLGLPLEIARAVFDRLGPALNVVTWEARYILSTELEFTGDEPLGPAAQVDDMLHIVRALQIDTCTLIGYCSGATTALLAAREHPEVFTHLVLVNGEYLLSRDKACPATEYQRSLEAFLPAVASGRKQASRIFARMGDIAMAGKQGERTELDRQINLPFSNEEYLFRYAKSYMAFRGLDTLALARAVRQPAFVVTGRQDVHCSTASSEAIADAIAGAERFVDDRGDHHELCRAGSATLEAIAAHLAGAA